MKLIDNPTVKRVLIALHRDLGFFFAGIVLIYAVSGLMMNHNDSINPNYSVEIVEFKLDNDFPADRSNISDAHIKALVDQVAQDGQLVKHFYTKGNLKLLFKGGSNIVVDLKGRTATYEKISRRFIISDMVRLHYNPGSWWTHFSDVFAVALIIITITGILIVKGRRGLIGRGGILLLLGLIVPILFLLC